MIRKIRNTLSLLFILSATFSSCSKYDDSDLQAKADDLTDRIATIEEWSKTVNTNITSLQGLITAMESNDIITSVVEAPDKSGYTINFSKSTAITIKHGANGSSGSNGSNGNNGNSGSNGIDGIDGTAPIVGTKKFDDGFYYWTIQKSDLSFDWLLDAQNNKIRTTGNGGKQGGDGKPATAPQVRINPETNMWEIKNDGAEWNNTNVIANGDSFFAEVDTSDPNNVTITLADGTEITLPCSSTPLTIGFESSEQIKITEYETTITVKLPKTLKKEDYTIISAEIKNGSGSNIDIKTRGNIDFWKVSITEPTFVKGVYEDNVEVKLVAPNDNNALEELTTLTVSIADKKGNKFTASLGFTAFIGYKVNVTTEGGLEAALEEAKLTPDKIKGMIITGTLGVDDFQYIKDNLKNLNALDLSETNISEIPMGAFGDMNGIFFNTTLKTFIFPKGLKSIGDYAFILCSGLSGNLTIPNGVTSIGIFAFSLCKGLTSLVLPTLLQSIGEGAFSGCGFTGILTIPKNVTEIRETAFIDLVYGIPVPDSKIEAFKMENPTPFEYTGQFRLKNGYVPIYVPKSSLNDYKNNGWGVHPLTGY